MLFLSYIERLYDMDSFTLRLLCLTQEEKTNSKVVKIMPIKLINTARM